jgi:hypothetical protein
VGVGAHVSRDVALVAMLAVFTRRTEVRIACQD